MKDKHNLARDCFSVVGTHLDLKYLMPRKDYLLRWLYEIADGGINTLLLEYEDKFPWSKYPFLHAEGAFTPDELRHFLTVARGLGIRVVPLVQTLSHLEFALLHDELAHLREMPDIPTQINPANPEAIAFVNDLIDEVLAYHEGDEWFHLGADEAWFLGTNPQYAEEVEQIGPQAYWARHTRRFIDKIAATGKRPIVWDDVLWRGLPHADVPDFPPQTILAAWDYGQRRFEPGMYPHVDVFRRAGFDVIGVPCLNWGVLTPMYDHNLENTGVWAAKAREADLLGLINSSWASFHTPLPTQMPYVAATAALLEENREKIDDGWMAEFLGRYFGAPAPDVSRALLELGTNWEHEVGLARPITPVVYSYMDMMLYYPNGVEDRCKRGGYPLEWETVDFVSILRLKVDLLRRDENQGAILEKITELQQVYDHAHTTLQDFEAKVTLHGAEAKLLTLLARVKALHTRILHLLVASEGDGAVLLSHLEDLRPAMIECLMPFLEPVALRRTLRIWWEPATVLLREISKQQP